MKKLTALFLASTALLAGCQFAQTIEPPTKDGKGIEGVSCFYVPVFNGAATQGVGCVVDGAKLQADKSYNFGGDLLVVRGDVAQDIHIDAGRAKVFVDGNLAQGVRIDASKPENYETDIVLMPMVMSCGQNCTTITLMPMPVTRSIGFKYPADTDPTMAITGSIGPEVKFVGNGTYTIANGNAAAYSNIYALPAVQQMMTPH